MAKTMTYSANSAPRVSSIRQSSSPARAHLQQIASAFKGSSVKSTPCGGCASGTKKNCCGH